MQMHYKSLLIMGAIHFILMFVLMYAMVDQFENVFSNLNQAYMAAIMTSPMLVLEVLMMGHMYENKKALKIILAVSVLISVLALIGIRQQTLIGDKEFLRSMIPHHAGAILMCEQANLDNSEIKELCNIIINSQKSEISQMKDLLEKIK